jgi:uncharacterized protein YjiS (DUF1127 family)
VTRYGLQKDAASKHMRSIACAPSPSHPGLINIVEGVRRLISALDTALEVRRERQMLLSMDDRALKDIGVNRSKAWTEANRSFWDIPVDRLRP